MKLGFDVTVADLVAQGGEVFFFFDRHSRRADRRRPAPRRADAGPLAPHRRAGSALAKNAVVHWVTQPRTCPIDGLHPPRFGVYAVLVDVLDGPHTGRYQGVASMGVRPMFGVNSPNLETFLFDFKGRSVWRAAVGGDWSNICATKSLTPVSTN